MGRINRECGGEKKAHVMTIQVQLYVRQTAGEAVAAANPVT